AALWETSIHSNDWVPVDIRSPNYVFVPRDQDKLTQYEMGVAINLLFLKSGNGIVTKRDQLCVQRSRVAVWETMLAFRDQPEAEVRRAYGIPADVRDWRYDWAKADVLAHFDPAYIQSINYRPFDQRFLLYTGNARGFVGWPVRQIMS